jgi:hypothetical protein
MQVFAQKTRSWSAKTNMINKKWQSIRKMMNLPSCLISIYIIVGNTVGKSLTGILTLFIQSWNSSNSKILVAFSTVPCLPCTANIQNMHLMQTNLSMNNKHCHDMQKKCNMVFAKKTCSWSANKTWSIKHDRILEKCNIICVCNAVFGGYHPV